MRAKRENLFHLLEPLLPHVEHPSRYLDHEWGAIEEQDGPFHVVLMYPDVYEVGLPNMGLSILYTAINRVEGMSCERGYLPWVDMADLMRAKDLPLLALESSSPIASFDVVGFTLAHEMACTNIVEALDLSRIPIRAEERAQEDPIVVAGGPSVWNCEPVSPMFDAVLLGDGEESIVDVCACIRDARADGVSRSGLLCRLAELPGVYVPSLYTHTYNPDGTLAAITPAPGAPARVKKRIVQDLDRAYFPTKTIVPSTQIVHDRSNLEIFRGCIRGCRFCQAGFCYRPIRAKSADTLCRQAIESLEDSGNSEITLASLSTSDYRELEALADGLLRYCEPRKINLSLPSLRADNFSRELMLRIQKVRKSGLTFAPEAGTQRLRDAINKNVTEEEILSTCATAFSGGWNSVKLYFMLGLPTETDEDVIGIAELVYKILQVWRENGSGKKRGLSINLATAYFVPKPFTPFQWAAQITPEEYLRRVHLLQANLHAKCVDYRYHESDLSRLEAVMARGDRRVGKALLEAHNIGCRLDGWDEYFDYEKWLEAFRRAGLDPDFYTTRGYGVDELLPWQTIDVGVTTNFLLREREKALRSESTPDCRTHCNGCGARRLSERGLCDESPAV